MYIYLIFLIFAFWIGFTQWKMPSKKSSLLLLAACLLMGGLFFLSLRFL